MSNINVSVSHHMLRESRIAVAHKMRFLATFFSVERGFRTRIGVENDIRIDARFFMTRIGVSEWVMRVYN